MFDVAIVGSGPAGTFSAYALKGKKVLLLDVGYLPEKSPELYGELFALRKKTPDLFGSLIGEKFESLHNLYKDNVSYKLISPYMTYILKNWRKLSPLKSDNFETMMSFAKGGLANAWGAGVYQFNDFDLKNFPINESELLPYYDKLTRHIGISGENDDLSIYFGKTENLMQPLNLSGFGKNFLKKYQKHRSNKKLNGFNVGRPRLAILTKDHCGRHAYQYDNMDFVKPYNPSVYNPAYTLNELEKEGLVTYLSGYLVLSYKEFDAYVKITAKKLSDNSIQKFKAKKIVIAAGALNTTKLVLKSNQDTVTKLPILDNPMACIPIIDLSKIGHKINRFDSPNAQLNIIFDDKTKRGRIQASLYGSSGPLRTDIIFAFPFSIPTNVSMTKYLAPAIGLVMIFYPGKLIQNNYIKLTVADELMINYEDDGVCDRIEPTFMKALRKMGYICFQALNQRPQIGNSLHYAGMLPMKSNPGKYQTDRDGKLYGSKHVFITDGACFSELPAKNLTFTEMANAMRIATKIRENLV